jgi:putative SOS response-associated peptidase YedK
VIIKPEAQNFFYLAGLYDSFYTAGEKKNRFVILTAPANKQMQDIHTRMPLIVPKEYAGRFLQCKLTPEVIKRVYALTSGLDIKQA